MPANPSMIVSGKGNLSIPPAGFVRVAPNYCRAIPRRSVNAPVWATGPNVIDISAAIPTSAKYVEINITWELNSQASLLAFTGADSSVRTNASGTGDAADGTAFGIVEQAIVAPAGTLMMRYAYKYLFPVFGDRQINLSLLLYDNATLASQPLRVIGYYD